MYFHYKSLAKHTRLLSNIILIASIIALPFDWRGALAGVVAGLLFRIIARSQDADVIKIAEKYKSHEAVKEFRRMGYSDDQISEIQKQAEQQSKE